MANVLEANSIFFVLITFGIDSVLITILFLLCSLIRYFISKRMSKEPMFVYSSLTTQLLQNKEKKNKDEDDGNIFKQIKLLFKYKASDIKRICTNDEQIYLVFLKYCYLLFCVRIFLIQC